MGKTTVSVVTMMSGVGLLTKSKKLVDGVDNITETAQTLTSPKAIKALDDVKKAERVVPQEKALKEFLGQVGEEFIEETADEIKDIAKSEGKKISVELWKKLRERGNKFNKKLRDLFPPKYDFHEVEVEVYKEINGKKVVKRYRLDSYDLSDGGKIVSRKATDFDKIQLKTFDDYLMELKRKYPVGAKIYTRKYPDDLPYGEKTLQGKLYIEVPKTNEASKRVGEFQKLANERGVILIFEAE